jgi:peroxiredoxin
VVVLGIAKGDDAERAKTFREKHKLTFPVISDPENKVSRRFTSGLIPFNAVVDGNGKLAYAALGANLARVKEAVDASLKADSSASPKAGSD